MKNTFLLCLLASVLGCKPNSSETAEATSSTNGSTLSAGAQKAVQMVGTALSGEATGSISPDGKTLELTIANSATLAAEPDLARLHVSRAAWIFYQNTGDENPSYEQLSIKVQEPDTTISIPYTLAELATVKARYPAIEQASKALISRDFVGLYALFDPVVMGPSKASDLEQYCTQIEPEYGKPTAFEFRGFSFDQSSTGMRFLSLAGNLKREIKDTPLNIAIDLTKPEGKGSLNSIKFSY